MDGTMTMDELLSIAEKIGVTKENIRFFDNAYSKNTPEEAALYLHERQIDESTEIKIMQAEYRS